MTHSDDRPFRCILCNKTFPREYVLKEHEWTHTGDKPFSCTICDCKCKRPNVLKKHERIHSSVKPFRLKIPREGFSKRSAVYEMCHSKADVKQSDKDLPSPETHEKHRQEQKSPTKSFFCLKCNKTFCLNIALMKHETKHNRVTYKG